MERMGITSPIHKANRMSCLSFDLGSQLSGLIWQMKILKEN